MGEPRSRGMSLRTTADRRGNAYRWRVDARGDVYEYVGLTMYHRRPKLSPGDVDAVGVSLRDVFLPLGRGEYALVHDCVLTTACEHCGARAGERCQNKGLLHSYTHWTRRKSAGRKRTKGQ